MSRKIAWIDWMKTISMYLIIAGHCEVPEEKFIWVFSVPCFFIISGFLSRKEDDKRSFAQKIWWNLMVPMALLYLFDLLWSIGLALMTESFQFEMIWTRTINALLGFHGIGRHFYGLGILWFVYTLIICKILLQFIPPRKEIISLVGINLLMLASRYIFKETLTDQYNAIINVLLAFPFFTIGYLLRPVKSYLSQMRNMTILVLFSLSVMVVWICGYFNDVVVMFNCSYGSNLFLCLLGGICGTIALFAVSKLCEKIFPRVIAEYMGGGTLLVLGFQFNVLFVLSLLFKFIGYNRYIEALLVYLICAPIIILVKHHLKILYGKYRQ